MSFSGELDSDGDREARVRSLSRCGVVFDPFLESRKNGWLFGISLPVEMASPMRFHLFWQRE